MSIAIELYGVDPDGVERVVTVSTGGGFTTTPADNPPNRVFLPRVIDAGRISRNLFRPGGDTFGRSEIGFGQIVLNNADGALKLKGWAFDGRRIVIRKSESEGGAYPADWQTILDGRLEGVTFPPRRIQFQIRDVQADVSEIPLVEEVFAGDNVAPDGLEGTPNDIKGSVKPIAYGRVRNAQPLLVNSSKVIYQTRYRGDLSCDLGSVYDNGAAKTIAADYASLTDLETVEPGDGEARAYEGSAADGTYFRLDTEPAGIVTFDLSVGASSERSAAAIMRQVLVDAGVPSRDIEEAADDGLLTPYECGYWSGSTALTAGVVLDAMAASFHGYWIGTRAGTFRIGSLTPPSGAAKAVLTYSDLLDPESALTLTTGSLDGVPAWRVTVLYQRNWLVQSADQLAGSVSLEDKAWREKDYRRVVVEDATIKDRHPYARELEFTTALDDPEGAAAFAAFLFDVYRVSRDTYECHVPLDKSADLELADVVELRVPVLDLSEGKLFRVIGIEEGIGEQRSKLTLWG